MSDDQQDQESPGNQARQPIFLLPRAVVILAGIMIVLHLARVLVLNESADGALILWFGFFPIRLLLPGEIAGGLWPLVWSPFTHALLHANWEHLLINTAWLAIFATPVVRRYGASALLWIFFLGAAAGAAAFAATTLPAVQVMIGASGGVAALTGAAVRFVFQPVIRARHPETGEIVVLGRRLARLDEVMRNRRSGFFIVIWVALNAAVPLLPLFTGGGGVQIAWQAHLGGFFAGLLLVPLFERRSAGEKP